MINSGKPNDTHLMWHDQFEVSVDAQLESKKKKDNKSIFYIDSGDLAALWVFPSIPDHTQLNDIINL